MGPVSYIHGDLLYPVSNGERISSQVNESMTNLYKRRTACRYYQTGSCRRGTNCPFAHAPVAGGVETYQTEHMHGYHLPPVYRPLDSQAYPVFLWKPYPLLSPSFDLRYGVVRQAEPCSDYADDKSDPSSADSSSTVANMDHQFRAAHDTPWLQGLKSTPSPPGDVGANSSPGYEAYGHPVFPAIKSKHIVGRGRATSVSGSMIPLSSSSLLPWQDGSRKKPLTYKTKPCKFYAANGKCTSGAKCTFIHDTESRASACAMLAPPADVNLPPKPVNKYDECRARGFYPITWRVIGGGVMMGGQRQICPEFAAGHCRYGGDCKLAHETELKTDPVGFIELKNEDVPVQEDDRSLQQTSKTAKRVYSSPQRPRPIRVSSPEPPGVPFPSVTPQLEEHASKVETVRKKGHEGAVPPTRDPPTSPVHRRTQSMSMVLTSPPPLDTTHSSYAAEL